MSESVANSLRIHRFAVLRVAEPPPTNRLQRSFYTRHYRPAFEAGVAMDVDGQHGYAAMMLHELLSLWTTDPTRAMAGMRLLVEAYPRTSVASEAQRCLADMHYLRAEWADALEHTYGHRRLVAFLGLSDLLDPRAEAWHFMRWSPPSMLKVGLQVADSTLEDMQTVLDSFHDEHGVSLVAYFWARLHSNEPLDELATSLEDLVGNYYSVERIAELIEFGRSLGPYTMTAFAGFEQYEQPIPTPTPWLNPYSFEGLFRALFRHLFRESENRARAGAGLPGVGEGNVAEVHLLRELQKAFPLERVEHQARPWWLAPQSLDIVFHGRDIAVEYQGIQHSRPVEFFGGQEAFKKQQERDATKRQLCKEHGMRLIEVHPDYVLDDVVREVRAALMALNASAET